MTTGKRIEILMVGHGWTVRELAGRVGVNPLAIRNWIADIKQPSAENLVILADEFNVDPLVVSMGLEFKQAIDQGQTLGELFRIFSTGSGFSARVIEQLSGSMVSRQNINLWERDRTVKGDIIRVSALIESRQFIEWLKYIVYRRGLTFDFHEGSALSSSKIRVDMRFMNEIADALQLLEDYPLLMEATTPSGIRFVRNDFAWDSRGISQRLVPILSDDELSERPGEMFAAVMNGLDGIDKVNGHQHVTGSADAELLGQALVIYREDAVSGDLLLGYLVDAGLIRQNEREGFFGQEDDVIIALFQKWMAYSRDAVPANFAEADNHFNFLRFAVSSSSVGSAELLGNAIAHIAIVDNYEHGVNEVWFRTSLGDHTGEAFEERVKIVAQKLILVVNNNRNYS